MIDCSRGMQFHVAPCARYLAAIRLATVHRSPFTVYGFSTVHRLPLTVYGFSTVRRSPFTVYGIWSI